MAAQIAGMDMKGLKKLMSNDLISRKALLKELREIMDEPHNTMFLMGIGAAVSIVEHRETAFDKEKVKEQIQIFRSKFECTCCPKNIGKHIPVSCDECMDTFAKANIVIVEKGGIK